CYQQQPQPEPQPTTRAWPSSARSATTFAITFPCKQPSNKNIFIGVRLYLNCSMECGEQRSSGVETGGCSTGWGMHQGRQVAATATNASSSQ
ncbi:Hypothetical predicted protein, partial [Drosophila guanche]